MRILITMLLFLGAVTVLILYSALVAASKDEESDDKYRAEHYWEK